MIKLYSQPSCGQCKLVHMMLDKANIAYEDCQDVNKMIEMGINHTPTLELDDGKRLVGKEIMEFIKRGN